MKHLVTVVYASLILLSGCTIALNYEDVSGNPGFKEWIGKEFKIKEELLIIYDSRRDVKYIKVPLPQFYPTIEEYRETGRKSKGMPYQEIIGIAKTGEIYTIESIGFCVFSSMIGKQGLILVKNKADGNEYYLHESDLFSFKGNSISLNNYYLEVVQLPGRYQTIESKQ